MNLALHISLIILIKMSIASSNTKLTNIKCEAFDKPFAIFKECDLKIPKRDTVSLNLYVKLFKLPVNNITVI